MFVICLPWDNSIGPIYYTSRIYSFPSLILDTLLGAQIDRPRIESPYKMNTWTCDHRDPKHLAYTQYTHCFGGDTRMRVLICTFCMGILLLILLILFFFMVFTLYWEIMRNIFLT